MFWTGSFRRYDTDDYEHQAKTQDGEDNRGNSNSSSVAARATSRIMARHANTRVGIASRKVSTAINIVEASGNAHTSDCRTLRECSLSVSPVRVGTVRAIFALHAATLLYVTVGYTRVETVRVEGTIIDAQTDSGIAMWLTLPRAHGGTILTAARVSGSAAIVALTVNTAVGKRSSAIGVSAARSADTSR